MVKKLLSILAVFTFLIPATLVFAADVSVPDSVDILITDPNPDITITVLSGSALNEIYVTGSSARFTSGMSDAFSIRCVNCDLANDAGITQTCNSNYSIIEKVAGAGSTQFTVTPSNSVTVCATQSSGGGSSSSSSDSGSSGSTTVPSSQSPGTTVLTSPSGSQAVTFSSVLDYQTLVSHWAFAYIRRVFDLGLMTGRGDSEGNKTWVPDDFMNRAEIAKVAMLTVDETPLLTPEAPFGDVSDISAWYYGYVTRAKALRYFKGDADGFFNPDKDITRAEVAVVFSRMTGQTVPKCTNKPFLDVDEGYYACGYILLLKQLGFIQGDDGKNTYRPDENMSRAEIAKIVTKFLDWANN